MSSLPGYLMVFLGGGLGAMLRHAVNRTPWMLNGASERDLTLSSWDEERQSWSSDGVVVRSRDPVNNALTLALHHLSEFALFGLLPESQEVHRIYLPIFPASGRTHARYLPIFHASELE